MLKIRQSFYEHKASRGLRSGGAFLRGKEKYVKINPIELGLIRMGEKGQWF